MFFSIFQHNLKGWGGAVAEARLQVMALQEAAIGGFSTLEDYNQGLAEFAMTWVFRTCGNDATVY